MKKVVLLLVAFAFLFSSDYESIYLKSGANAVIKEIEKNILSDEFWTKKLQNLDVRYGYYDSKMLLNVVAKESKKLELFEYLNGVLTLKFTSDVLVGKKGDKLVEGDLKTPIGVYQLTRRFTPNDPYLGPLAFSLSYPNLYDKLNKRTGSGIWIHGLPLNGERDNDVTKGCVVMENDILIQYDKLIDYTKSLAIVYEDDIKYASKDDIGLLFAEIFRWKKAWQENDIDAYLAFYDKNFKRYDGLELDKFASSKRAIFSKNEQKTIIFSDFVISPYPNSNIKDMFRISFYEDYKALNYKFQGIKTLYVKLENKKMKILIEE
ncbi:L,D-transpeptidase family protein [Campylobacter majalis]|uniref:L,D-transpeptidase family protein n=1 Tax=Campylobacter majalis TaxID=2790656 RepID=UPI003D690F22